MPSPYQRFSRLKYPCRTLFIVMFFSVVGVCLLLGTTFFGIEYQRKQEFIAIFPTELPSLNYDPEMNGENVSMDNPRLVAYLRDRYLVAPPSTILPHYLWKGWTPRQSPDTKRIMNLLGEMRKGFFVDCGGFNESLSTTLNMERSYQWTGILIEANPVNFNKLSSESNRNAFLSPSCLSNRPYPIVVSFMHHENGTGKISDWPLGGEHPHHVDVQCFPLYTFLLAVNTTVVDFFNLDVGGGELQVLRSIPWSGVDIKVLAVNAATEDQSQAVEGLLKQNGYRARYKAGTRPGSDVYDKAPI